MKRKEQSNSKSFKRIAAALLSLLLLTSFVGCTDEKGMQEFEELVGENLQENATQNTIHYVQNYEVAVVFDNSGSMYTGKNAKGWSRAKYAMEIFASMLNYNQREEVPGDVLKIFPMWPVTVDGTKPKSNGSKKDIEPIEVTNVSDIDKIHDMYTIEALGTPYDTVKKAFKELKRSSAPKKWLIILTDGEFDNISASSFAKKVRALASDKIQVQYLGIGDAANIDRYATKNFFTKKSSSSSSLKNDIIDICNHMFQRDQLPESSLQGNQLTLDVSMRNLIVFVQGSDAKLNGLKNASGEEVPIEMDSKQRTYSKVSAGNYPKAPYDKELSGQVVTFGACEKGVYTIDYENAESIQIFYTPNIDIALTFSDANGNAIDMTGNGERIYPGKFKLNYYLIDGITKEDMTQSPLLAPVKFEGGYVDSSGKSKNIENGEDVILEPDSSTFLRVKASYLNDYEISTDDRKEDYTVAIEYPPIDVDLEVEQKKAWYQQSDVDNWKPVVASLTIDGKPLSDVQMKNTKLIISDDGQGISYQIENCEESSEMKIHIGRNSEGEIQKIKDGEYTLTVAAEYQSKNKGEFAKGKSDTAKIKVKSYPRWLIFVGIALLILLLLGILYWYMMHKSFPATMYLKRELSTNAFTIRKKGMNLIPGPGGGIITCNARPLSAHMDRKSKKARVEISAVNCGPSVQQFSINGQTYTRTSGGFVDDSGKKLDSNKKFTLKNNTQIEWKAGGKYNSGNVVFSRKDSKKRNKKSKYNK